MKTIIEILNEIRPEFDFADSKDYIEDGMLDSFDVVTLVTELEANFDIVIDGLDIVPENFSHISNIENLVKKSGGML